MIRIALADHHHVNRSFNLLGLTYPDWLQVDLKEGVGGKERKRAEASDNPTSTSKQGGSSHGHVGESKADRVIAAKVPTSSVGSLVLMAKLGYVSLLVPWPSTVGGSLPGHKMPSISSLPILQEIFDDAMMGKKRRR